MNKYIRLFLSGLVLLGSSAAIHMTLLAAPPEGGKITGVVSDRNGQAVAGINVFADAAGPPWPSNGVATTAANGRYTIAGLDNGLYRVIFQDSVTPRRYTTAYYDNAATLQDAKVLSVTAGTTIANVNAQLVPAGKISGRVTNPNGNPLVGASVNVLVDRDHNGEWEYGGADPQLTDKQGTYTVAGLDAGVYRVQIFWNANPTLYPPKFYANAPTARIATDVVVAAGGTTTGIDVQMESFTGTITGKVTTEQSAPLPDINVALYEDFDGDGQWEWFWHEPIKTAANGTYSLAGLHDGDYRLYFWQSPAASSFCSSSVIYSPEYYDNADDLRLARTISVRQGQTVPDINAQLASTGRLQGQVLDVHGSPFTGLVVRALPVQDNGYGCFYTNIDASGHYELRLPKGLYRIYFGGCTITHGGQPNPCPPSEYYPDTSSPDQATLFTIVSGTLLTEINARLPALDGTPEARDDPMLVAATATPNQFISVRSVLTNDYDVQKDQLTAIVDTLPSHGVLTLSADGFFTYTLSSGGLISDTFTYRANDGTHTSNVATVMLTPVNARSFLPAASR